VIARVLAIAAATLRENARSAVARVAALMILICVPAMAWLIGDDEPGRVWAARTVTVEGLRLILPLAAVVGGAFLLRPNLKRGWALLPARRGEWFIGAALAGLCMILLSTALFLAGAFAVGAGDDSQLVRPQGATSVANLPEQIRSSLGKHGRVWAGTGRLQSLAFNFDRPPTDVFEGEIDFELAWTEQAPPARGVPFAVQAVGETTVQAEVRSLSRRRAAFSGPLPKGANIKLVVTPTDPTLLVGIAESDIFVQAGKVSPVASMLALALLAIAASALCMAVSLWFRAWATAPTAALAGVLLLAALTLLPGIAPTGQMAADRRAAVDNDKDAMQRLESAATSLPELLPGNGFDNYLRGREVESTLPAVVWRIGIALALLPLGAITFRRRQIAK